MTIEIGKIAQNQAPLSKEVHEEDRVELSQDPDLLDLPADLQPVEPVV